MEEMEDNSVDVIVDDPPYNTGNTESKVTGYDQSESIIKQRWDNVHGSWDKIADMWEFTRTWLTPTKRVLKPTGSLFIFGTHHNIPITDLILKEMGFWVCQWIAYTIPNSFPNRKMLQQVSSNQVIIHARKSQSPVHAYQVERAKDYGVLDYWRRTGKLPRTKDGEIYRPNLRDAWPINNDGRAAVRYPFLVHTAKKPPEVVARCIDIALPETGGVVLDSFLGSGTTLEVCQHLNDWILTPRDVLPTCYGSELFIEYARMAALRCEAEVRTLEGGSSLRESDRKEIAKKAGDYASYILNGEWKSTAIPELVRSWDKPRPKLKRPKESVRDGEIRAQPNISELDTLLPLWEDNE
jgi:site-specific DNA-methyltransferase (adenine-specific)